MSTLLVQQASRWYGNVVAVNDVSMEIGPGITGLLGPNGAGKTTLLGMLGGFLEPSSGAVTLDGVPVWRNVELYRRIGIVPEREAMYDSLSGWGVVLANAKLHGLADAEGATRRAIEVVDMAAVQHREVRTYSKGMRQRIKLATAIVHEPDVLLLDEPFNGMDPRQRLHLMDVLRSLGADGRTIIFSSHILEEVEQVAANVEVLVSGRHAASGDFRELRRLMTQRPHRYLVRSSDDRRLASSLITEPSVRAVELLDGLEPTLEVQVTDLTDFARVLPRRAAADEVRLLEVTPADESLESVFAYLVDR